jgi:hypothetical protein
MFYGKVKRLPPMTNMRGMSGGPIFSMQRVDGTVRYWLHSMQVSANPDHISACLVRPFADRIRSIMEQDDLPGP